MEHHPPHSHHHDHQARQSPDRDRQSHPGSDGHQRFLDLDAEVFGDQLAAVLDRTGVADAREVFDLGAGTGVGSRLLHRRFPDAAVTCVDNDLHMLELLRRQGFAVVEADLDDGFPMDTRSSGTEDSVAAGMVDLVWASSSLHHVAHPARLLSGVRRALAPGGVLVVVELADLPSFLGDPIPGDSSFADPSPGNPSPGDPLRALEQRCHAAAATEGWNHHPDWTPIIEAAGFAVTRSEVTTVAPVTPSAKEYAQGWFERFSHLTTLTRDDRDAVGDLLERFSDVELHPRATRTVWVATRDHPATSPAPATSAEHARITTRIGSRAPAR
ncbi:SAM-dependent methyltransferase [Nakamurella sp. UYEF19]|uniref:class I SAM-dependent methyltransferase n=1 Tax=Nakamurella sp. UYEF19 TaxID=1756392 RepID=UPI00339884B1